MSISVAALVLPALLLAAANATPQHVSRAVTPLPANGRWDYQIGGAYTPAADVRVVTRHHTDSPAAGLYNICYINAFQTQPEEEQFWKGNVTLDALLLRDSSGNYLEDPEWPKEFILDTRTTATRNTIMGVLRTWIDECARKGFVGLEPDNLDSYMRSAGQVQLSDNVELAKLFTAYAQGQGLAVAQKNTAELEDADRNAIGFNFAVAEECEAEQECDDYTGPYGNQVIEVEYTDEKNAQASFTNACRKRGGQISVIFRDRDVVPPNDDAYHYEEC